MNNYQNKRPSNRADRGLIIAALIFLAASVILAPFLIPNDLKHWQEWYGGLISAILGGAAAGFAAAYTVSKTNKATREAAQITINADRYSRKLAEIDLQRDNLRRHLEFTNLITMQIDDLKSDLIAAYTTSKNRNTPIQNVKWITKYNASGALLGFKTDDPQIDSDWQNIILPLIPISSLPKLMELPLWLRRDHANFDRHGFDLELLESLDAFISKSTYVARWPSSRIDEISPDRLFDFVEELITATEIGRGYGKLLGERITALNSKAEAYEDWFRKHDEIPA